MPRRLQIRFDDPGAFRDEYQRNLSSGGAFVATAEALGFRDPVELEVALAWCDQAVVLEAEVVGSAAAPSGETGVALQLLDELSAIRDRLERFVEPPAAPAVSAPDDEPGDRQPFFDPSERELTAAPDPPPCELAPEPALDPWEPDLLSQADASGSHVPPEPLAPPAPEPADHLAGAGDERGDPPTEATEERPDPLADVSDRRRAPRAAARVPVRLDATNVSLEGRTRDLSETGVLISTDASELPVGKAVDLELVRPVSGERLRVQGRVARRVEEDGTVMAVGVHFEGSNDPQELAAFVNEAKEMEAERLEGGISGVIEELGMVNLLQMLGASSERGTLTVLRGNEEGVIAFESGMLRYARLGPLCAGKALARLLAWDSGTFSFHSQVDPLVQEDPPSPLAAAILDALRQIDEARLADRASPTPATVFQMDREALRRASSLSKIEEAVVELAAAGFTLRRILDVIPEADGEIYAAVQALEKRGIVKRAG